MTKVIRKKLVSISISTHDNGFSSEATLNNMGEYTSDFVKLVHANSSELLGHVMKLISDDERNRIEFEASKVKTKTEKEGKTSEDLSFL